MLPCACLQRQQHMQRLKEADNSSNNLIGGRVKGFAGVYDIPTEIRKRTGGGGGSGGSGSGGAKGGFSQGFGGTAMGFSSAPVAAAAAAAATTTTPEAVLAGMQDHGDSSRSLTAAALLGTAGSSSSGSMSLPSGDSFGAVALGSSTSSSSRSVVTTSTSSTSSAEAWRAAARPAAAAAAAAADALAGEGLPTAPVRPGKAPEQRLAQDFLLMPTRDSLTYLDGSLPGDLGFDPLGLFEAQPAGAAAGAALDRRWLATSEVIHGRWAMLAVLGCLAPEVAGKGVWWEAPLAVLGAAGGSSSSSSAAAAADAAGSGAGLVAAPVLLAVLAVAEWCRLQDYKQPGSMAEPLQVLLPQGSSLSGGFAGSGQAAYPGGPLFNFANYVQSGPAMCQFKESEVKHGRLAMLTMLGFVCQAMLTEEGPWENLREHLAAPVQYNLLTEFGTGLGDWEFEEARAGLEEGAGLSPEVAAGHWFDGLTGRPYILAGSTVAEEAGMHA